MYKYDEFLKKYINVYWLRAENAIFSANLAVAIRNNISFNKNEKILEIACGDGIFSFLAFGGDFDKKFDIYSSVKKLDRSVENDDVFDFYNDEKYLPLISKYSQIKIDKALDIKESLLKKAEKLQLYKKTKLYNIETMSIEEEIYYDKVFLFSAIMHIEKINFLLKDVYANMSKNGKFYVNILTPKIVSFYEKVSSHYGKNFSSIMERDMRSLWPSLYTIKEWEDIFNANGFRVKNIANVMDDSFAPIWNVGTRMYFSQVANMFNEVKKYNEDSAMEIKQDHINTTLLFAKEFEASSNIDNSCASLFILEKK